MHVLFVFVFVCVCVSVCVNTNCAHNSLRRDLWCGNVCVWVSWSRECKHIYVSI